MVFVKLNRYIILGILIVIVGMFLSVFIIGIPIMVLGSILVYYGIFLEFYKKGKKFNSFLKRLGFFELPPEIQQRIVQVLIIGILAIILILTTIFVISHS